MGAVDRDPSNAENRNRIDGVDGGDLPATSTPVGFRIGPATSPSEPTVRVD